MVELSDSDYQALVKNADDNKQLVAIVTRVLIAIVVLVSLVLYGHQPIDILIEKIHSNVQNEIALAKAYNNSEIMKIERGDMTMEEYLKWLEVRGDLYSNNSD